MIGIPGVLSGDFSFEQVEQTLQETPAKNKKSGVIGAKERGGV